MINLNSTFQPDWVSPPGDTISDLLDERDWTQEDLAQRLGLSTKHLSQLINGKVVLTEETAFRLERVLGSTAKFWLNREAKYREHFARIQSYERCKDWTKWLDKLPMAELKKAHVIPKERITPKVKPALVDTLLKFFGVASPQEWESCYQGMEGAFRRTKENQSDTGAIASWLRLGEIEAEKLQTQKYNKIKFEKALIEIRQLTNEKPEIFEPKLRKLCSEAGVKFVMVPSIPRAHVSGVARWLNKHSPLIQLSLYGKTNDKFWFTFFHEAAHLLLHSTEKKTIYLDELTNKQQEDPEEIEANTWARDYLIPACYIDSLPTLKSKKAAIHFAQEVGVHAGIVAGRLQHDKFIEPSWFNELKVSFRFKND